MNDINVRTFYLNDRAEGIEDLSNMTSNGPAYFVQPSIRYDVQRGQRFFLLNFLSELDQEGDYTIEDDMIYAIPPGPLSRDDDMILSVTDQIFTSQAQAQEFHSLHLEMCLGFAVLATGSYFVINQTVISNTGNAAVKISQCHFGCQVLNSTFYELGQGGIYNPLKDNSEYGLCFIDGIQFTTHGA
ncbi:hypothetical protein FDP41_009816 [Naegleria fowleri]|uniref:Uncharacterized protein n=1 Tax=Naegleria fowleri TaxID=5763 RepID=A0A6A5BDG5_NAEFO|nr:uncharacterized protein FDP41_009816 [Naegleria fowleri]KAF0972120.1 hypothetical protein FDP41_009816 [Naegleria fowleri]CAG4712052.1 unnamed protein product [Naegleria fowleri]